MNLYPPIMPDILPAFTGNTCKIYFSLSDYNTPSEIKQVQISIVNQQTNASVLDEPSGIKLATLALNSNIQDDYKYYVEVSANFETNQFYKVQLRFSSEVYSKELTTQTFENWLYKNRNVFSEWSRVCLIKNIEKPQLTINGFEQNGQSEDDIILTNSTLNIVGQLTNLNESEYLKNYNIKIYQDNNLIMDSGEIYTNPYAPNEFNYEVPYNLLNGITYNLFFTYTTSNLYTETKTYNFSVVQNGFDRLDATITATPDEERGQIKINIVSTTGDNFIGNITIRRTSSKSNFHKWEDVKTITYMTQSQLNYTWYDRTIESGIWYKYCAQKRNSYGYRGIIIQIQNPVMCLFDDIFLTSGDRQLKIKFNPSLNELKYNVTESQQVALGAKYPYIKRNSENYFRTFPIGGLISSFMDTTNWYDPNLEKKNHNESENQFEQNDFKEINNLGIFYSKDDIYGDSKQLYDQYNSNNNITEYNDYIYEREFRNKVYDFLYEYNIKLFRSTTEGNILIKLMNIDFQPVEVLGRRLYSFTATAVEIDEANIANYDKYNIQSIGTYQKQTTYKHQVLGQLFYKTNSKNQDNNQDIMQLIRDKYKNLADEGFINQVNSLSWLRIEIESEPESYNNISGYEIEINGQTIIIPSTIERKIINGSPQIVHIGYFELKGDNVEIESLVTNISITATIDYVAVLEEQEDLSQIIRKYYYYQKVGQLYDTFSCADAPIGQIYEKYLFNYIDQQKNRCYQRLINVNGVQIESEPGTVVYIKDSKDNNFNRHVLENGYLQLMDDQVNIEGLYLCGIHLYQSKSNYARKNEYIYVDDDPEMTPREDLPINPVPNGVYIINAEVFDNVVEYNATSGLAVVYANSVIKEVNRDYSAILTSLIDNAFIYYNGKWCVFSKSTKDVLCPVDAIINYYCEVMKGVY